MDDSCVNCNDSASSLATLLLESGERIKETPLCEQCYSFFADMDTIEVFDAPILMRGGDDEDSA